MFTRPRFMYSRWSARTYLKNFMLTMIPTLFVIYLGMVFFVVYSIKSGWLATVFAFPVVLPGYIYLTVAPNTSFNLEQYLADRGRVGRIIDGALVLLVGEFAGFVTVSLLTRHYGEAHPILAVGAWLATLVLGLAVFFRRNRRYYKDGVNPWMTGPLQPV